MKGVPSLLSKPPGPILYSDRFSHCFPIREAAVTFFAWKALYKREKLTRTEHLGSVQTCLSCCSQERACYLKINKECQSLKWLTDCFLSNAIPDSPWLFFRSLDFSLQINYDDTSLLFRNVTVSLQKSLPQYAARKASGGNCTSVTKCNKKHHSSQVALPLVNASKSHLDLCIRR